MPPVVSSPAGVLGLLGNAMSESRGCKDCVKTSGGRIGGAGVLMVAIAAIALMAAPTLSAAASSCVIQDPNGDASWPGGAPPYEDVVLVAISRKGSNLIFAMELAGPVPDHPAMPVGTSEIFWVWGLDTDPATSPKGGFPLSAGEPHSEEFYVLVFWDGIQFTGLLVDRRPLLSGEAAIVTDIPFIIKGDEITVTAGAAMVGNPESFMWDAGTVNFFSPLNTEGWFPVDGTVISPWPC